MITITSARDATKEEIDIGKVIKKEKPSDNDLPYREREENFSTKEK